MLGSVQLAKAGISTSRLAFGTSRLHYTTQRERQNLLDSAASLGFTHFDTAPAYGDGLAEYELGYFARGRRSGITIATKYGIPADPIVERWSSTFPPVRAATAAAKRMGFRRQGLPTLTATGLQESVERSLRRL